MPSSEPLRRSSTQVGVPLWGASGLWLGGELIAGGGGGGGGCEALAAVGGGEGAATQTLPLSILKAA
jgi:hypothetical protein